MLAGKFSGSAKQKFDLAIQRTEYTTAVAAGDYPKTWKMYCAMNVAFGVVGYPLGDLWLLSPTGPLVPLGWDTWANVVVMVAIVVPVVVYVSVPMVIWFGAHWLFAPWRKSDNCLVALAEEGFPCCLADGP